MSLQLSRESPTHLLPRVVSVLLLQFFLLGCGKSPISPGGMPVPTGHSLLQVQGYDIPSGDYPACHPVTLPSRGKTVWADVDVQQNGDEWVARRFSGTTDDIEFHLRGTGSSTLQGQTISGTILGGVLDIGTVPYVQPRGVRVTFAGQTGTGPGAMTGTANLSGFVSGWLTGTITFTGEGTNDVGLCSAVSFSLQAYNQ